MFSMAQSTGAVEYTDYISTEYNTSSTSVMDITVNNLMVRPQ